MALIIELITKGSSRNDDDFKKLEVKQLSFVLTDDFYDVIEIIDIEMTDEDSDSKLEKLHYIFEKSNVIIAYNCEFKLKVLKNLLLEKNIEEDIDWKTHVCIIDKTKDIVKKINRYGLIDPQISDITIKLFEESFVDIQNSRYTALTLQRICKKLHEDDKLNISTKPTLINKLTKSFKKLVVHSSKIPQLHSPLGRSLRLEF